VQDPLKKAANANAQRQLENVAVLYEQCCEWQILTSAPAPVAEVESSMTQSSVSSAQSAAPALHTDDTDTAMKSSRTAQSAAADTELRRRKPKASGYPLGVMQNLMSNIILCFCFALVC